MRFSELTDDQWALIEPLLPPREKKRGKPGRPKRFDRATYHRVRYTVERFFAWVKAFRRITIRYERVSAAYSGFVHLACITLHLRILK